MPDTILEINEKDTIVTTMEHRIHDGLAEHFLTCSAAEDDHSFYVWSISSSPPDSIFSDPCDASLVNNQTQPAGSKCVLVQAELNMKVYFTPNRRRRHRHLSDGRTRFLNLASVTSADPEVVTESREYLVSAMSGGSFDDSEKVLQTLFHAFVVEQSGHATIDRGVFAVAGAQGQLMNEDERSNVVGGAMTMLAASICLVVVGVVTVRRRKKRSDDFLSHIDGLSTASDCERSEWNRGAEIVGDIDGSSLGWFGEDLHNGICMPARDDNKGSMDQQHDVHRCTSAFCEICLQQKAPIFVATSSWNIPGILEDLRSGSLLDEDKSCSSPDTIVL